MVKISDLSGRREIALDYESARPTTSGWFIRNHELHLEAACQAAEYAMGVWMLQVDAGMAAHQPPLSTLGPSRFGQARCPLLAENCLSRWQRETTASAEEQPSREINLTAWRGPNAHNSKSKSTASTAPIQD
jgi:hypothetical protein